MVTLDEMKQYLRVDFDDDDSLITDLIIGAVKLCKDICRVDTEEELAEVENAKPGMGIDVMAPEKGLMNLKKNGVIDPAKVTKEAVKNATSIAATAITMGALICEIPEPPKPATPDMGGMY